MGTLTAPVSGSGSCPAWIARVSNSTLDLAPLEPEHMSEPRERLAQGARSRPLLPVHRQGSQRTGLAVGLEVDPADHVGAVEQRQHVVAVDARVRRFVDLEAVLEAEQALGLEAIPEQVVERREQVGARRLDVTRDGAIRVLG